MVYADPKLIYIIGKTNDFIWFEYLFILIFGSFIKNNSNLLSYLALCEIRTRAQLHDKPTITQLGLQLHDLQKSSK